MKLLLMCIAPLMLAGLLVYVAGNQNKSRQQSVPLPANWSIYPKPSPGSADMLCGNYSNRYWSVSVEREELKVRLRPEESKSAGALPFRIRLQNNEDDGIHGRRIVYQLHDGWLVGFDAGEWGGSLWWFSADGKRSRKLSNENIIYFVKLSSDVLVLTGLNHMSIDEGKVLRVTKDRGGKYLAEVFVTLDGEPRTYIQESPDSLLILTTQGVRRLKSSASLERLFETDFAILYPGSMALTKEGVFYLGIRHYVVRLIPVENGYKEEWLIPNDCRKFEIRDYDCVCMQSPNSK